MIVISRFTGTDCKPTTITGTTFELGAVVSVFPEGAGIGE